MLIFLVGLTKVRDNDTGVASSLVNVGQQVGGSIGLAVIGTVAWSAVASNLSSQAAAAARAGVHPSGARAAALQTQMYDHALATGFSRAYLVSARHHDARRDHRDSHHPGQAPGPVRRGPHIGAGRLTPPHQAGRKALWGARSLPGL